MLTHQTVERLRQMRLWGMADAFLPQLEQPDAAALSFEDRLGLLVDQEVSYRDNRRLKRLLKEAKLRQQACLEDIDLSVGRGLGRQLLRSLGSGLCRQPPERACYGADRGRQDLRLMRSGQLGVPPGLQRQVLPCAQVVDRHRGQPR